MIEQQFANEFRELEADSDFISGKIAEFSQKYPRQFIAIKDRQIIAIGDSFEGVLDKVKEKGLEPGSVLIEYIPDKGEIILY